MPARLSGLRNATVRDARGGALLRDVTLLARQGELLVVLGHSGSGKSTLLRAIAGLAPVTAGEVLIDGRRVTRLPPHERGAAMVFEQSPVLPFLDVHENLGWGLTTRRVSAQDREQRIREQSRGLRLSRLLRRMPRTLSSGELGRLGIGRALVQRPSVFLFDEPLAHLDAAERRATRRRLVDVVRRSGASALYVTHDQHDAMAIADRIAVLHHGRVRQIDTPRALYDTPADLVVASAMGEPGLGLLPATLLNAGSMAAYRVAGRTLPLWAPAPPGLAGVTPREVVIGVRPEHVYDARAGADPALVTLTGMVVSVEEVGAVAHVGLELDATAVTDPASSEGLASSARRAGRARLDARFARHTTVRPGDAVPIAIDVARAMVFDPVTGTALHHPDPEGRGPEGAGPDRP